MSEPEPHSPLPMDEVSDAAPASPAGPVHDAQPAGELVDGYLPMPPNRPWADMVEEDEAADQVAPSPVAAQEGKGAAGPAVAGHLCSICCTDAGAHAAWCSEQHGQRPSAVMLEAFAVYKDVPAEIFAHLTLPEKSTVRAAREEARKAGGPLLHWEAGMTIAEAVAARADRAKKLQRAAEARQRAVEAQAAAQAAAAAAGLAVEPAVPAAPPAPAAPAGAFAPAPFGPFLAPTPAQQGKGAKQPPKAQPKQQAKAQAKVQPEAQPEVHKRARQESHPQVGQSMADCLRRAQDNLKEAHQEMAKQGDEIARLKRMMEVQRSYAGDVFANLQGTTKALHTVLEECKPLRERVTALEQQLVGLVRELMGLLVERTELFMGIVGRDQHIECLRMRMTEAGVEDPFPAGMYSARPARLPPATLPTVVIPEGRTVLESDLKRLRAQAAQVVGDSLAEATARLEQLTTAAERRLSAPPILPFAYPPDVDASAPDAGAPDE